MVDSIAGFDPDLPAAAASIADAPLGAADAAQHESSSESSSGIDDSEDDSSASNGGIRGGFNSHSPGTAGQQGDSFDDDDDGYVDTLRRRLAADGSGFESAFDDEFEPMRYCVNCTGALHGDVCLVRLACWPCGMRSCVLVLCMREMRRSKCRECTRAAVTAGLWAHAGLRGCSI